MNTPSPQSTLSGIDWPPVPGALGATVLAMQFQLEQSQWWSASALQVAQLRQLQRLLRHARQTVPFYRERLAQLDLQSPLGMEAFQALPCLTRPQLQAQAPQLLSMACPRDHLPIRQVRTSGSTGLPVDVHTTRVSALFHNTLDLRNHLWQRHDFSSRLANIRAVYADMAKTSPAWSSVFPTGPELRLDSGTPISEQLLWLRREEAGHLLTYPSNLQALAQQALATGTQLPQLQRISVQGEVLTAATRELCQNAFGIAVDATYSCEEAGFMALQCPQHSHYHVQAESVLLEVLDGNNQPCGAGEIGKVVITPLHNFAMPLLRYEVGDFAEVGEPCDCGRGLPVLRQVMGRSRNMLRRPDGERFWPSVSLAAWAGCGPINQLQVVQTRRDSLDIQLVAQRPLTAAEQQQLRAIVAQDLGPGFSVNLVYLQHIPRSAGGKFEDFRCECD